VNDARYAIQGRPTIPEGVDGSHKDEFILHLYLGSLFFVKEVI
jgi:hypothetical protein